MSRKAPRKPQKRLVTHRRLSAESRDSESRSDEPSFKALVSLSDTRGLECPDEFHGPEARRSCRRAGGLYADATHHAPDPGSHPGPGGQDPRRHDSILFGP